MSLKEMLPSVRSLPPREKLQLLHFLADEIAAESGVPTLDADVTYPIWTPLPDSGEAAKTLSAFLEATPKAL